MTPLNESMVVLPLGALALVAALLFHDPMSWAIGVVLLLIAFALAWAVSQAFCRRRRCNGVRDET